MLLNFKLYLLVKDMCLLYGTASTKNKTSLVENDSLLTSTTSESFYTKRSLLPTTHSVYDRFL